MLKTSWRGGAVAGAALFVGGVLAAGGGTVNGNDLALGIVEAADDAGRQALIAAAGRRPHFFRYLQIMTLENLGDSDRAGVRITALEPSSALDVVFTVRQSVSLSKLREDPASVPGRALAVSGVVQTVDFENRTIHLDPVVVRHKDRLAPVAGKEMLYEFDDKGLFYTFSGGREQVKVSYRDRDLLRHRDRIVEEGGDQAWADFLTRELERRAKEREGGVHAP